MYPNAIRPWLSMAMLSSLASSGLGFRFCVTGTLAPSDADGMLAVAQFGFTPEGTQPMSPASGASGPGSGRHWPSSGVQYFCGRPTSVQAERMAPVSAQSNQPLHGPVAQLPLTQTEPVLQSLLTLHWPQNPQPLGLALGTLGSFT